MKNFFFKFKDFATYRPKVRLCTVILQGYVKKFKF